MKDIAGALLIGILIASIAGCTATIHLSNNNKELEMYKFQHSKEFKK